MTDAKKQLGSAARERVRGFDRSRKLLNRHINRVSRRTRRYENDPANEEAYFRCLRVLGYLVQVQVAAQKAAFEQEIAILEDGLEEFERVRLENDRLKRLEAEYVRVISSQGQSPSPEQGQ